MSQGHVFGCFSPGKSTPVRSPKHTRLACQGENDNDSIILIKINNDNIILVNINNDNIIPIQIDNDNNILINYNNDNIINNNNVRRSTVSKTNIPPTTTVSKSANKVYKTKHLDTVSFQKHLLVCLLDVLKIPSNKIYLMLLK